MAIREITEQIVGDEESLRQRHPEGILVYQPADQHARLIAVADTYDDVIDWCGRRANECFRLFLPKGFVLEDSSR